MVAEFLLQSLRHVWETLQQARVPAAIMGGVALSAWQHLRMTRDLDLLVDIKATDRDTVIKRLREAGFQVKNDPPVLRLGEIEIVQLLFEPPDSFLQIRIDLFLARSDFHRQALSRRVPFRFPENDFEVHVIACDDLIILKLIAGRIIDRADAAYLLRANRNGLDLHYLVEWCQRLRLEKDLNEVWEEAFPGETLPLRDE